MPFVPLTDMLGSVVLKKVLNNRHYEYLLDIRGLAPGAYTLRLSDQGQPMYSQLVIVK